MISEKTFLKVLSNEILGDGLFLLSFERGEKSFCSGQYLRIAPKDTKHQREYSVYSGTSENHLSLLARIIPSGTLSPRLARLQKDDVLTIWGPYGYFLVEASIKARVPLLFLATGVGISPFRSFLMSYPNMVDYLLVHGIRHSWEKVLQRDFPPDKVITCLSQPKNEHLGKNDFPGRITAWLEQNSIDPRTHVFLCGNCSMIHQAFDLLSHQGIDSNQIFTEVYF